MNILIDNLPKAVTIGGKRYTPETDYRAAVAFEILAESDEATEEKLLRCFYPQEIPEDTKNAMLAALWIYGRGNVPLNKKEETKGAKTARAYSFAFDAAAIYADFWRYYDIDLSNEALHWWTFHALLAGLPDESGYKKRIFYRTCSLKGLPKSEQARIKKIRKEIALSKKEKGKLSLAERNAQMRAYVAKRVLETKGG